MNLIDEINKYKFILSLTNPKNLTKEKLNAVLKTMGFNIDLDLIAVISDVVKEGANQYKSKNLFELLSNDEFTSSVIPLLESQSKVSNNVDSLEGNLNPNNFYNLHKDVMFKCTHCDGINHLDSIMKRSQAKLRDQN